MYAYSAAVFLSTARFQANTKSFAVTGSPFDHFAFLFNVNVYFLPSSLFLYDSATPGVALLSLSSRYKPSITLFKARNDTWSVALAESIDGIS
ncbi:Uncharacterised protein [Streptococcus pneumoniae]|nr:Uncharacterised protein [Streptococcus pneumoniae]CJC38080.1 Uncharacterised protein [Streptococcus pneumoniae]CJH90244.1 Uncharacterised protein [Streptococcus pneumoniae]CJJ14418.1 Uncharacterised protein [Streptococcus pneumoniae]